MQSPAENLERAPAAPRKRGNSERRQEQILEAFFNCVARNGIKDSTVAHVAEESGLQRTLIYHYFRDRGILIDRLIDYIIERTELRLFRAISRSRSTGPGRVMRLIDYFLGDGYTDAPPEDFVVFGEVVSLGLRDSHVGERVTSVWSTWLSFVDHELMRAFPDVPESRRTAVAYGLILMFEQNAYMRILGLEEARGDYARNAALALLAPLEAAPAPEDGKPNMTELHRS